MNSNELALFRCLAIKLNNVKTNRKGKDSSSLLVAIGHNKRVPQHTGKGDIDPERSHLNYSLFPDLPTKPEDVHNKAESLLNEQAYVLPRTDSVVATECLFSLHESSPVTDLRSYFLDCAKWAKKEFKGIILSADVHLDESNPHCHVIILLPLTPTSISGSKMVGNKQAITLRTQTFYRTIAKSYGLRQPPKALTGESRETAAASVIARMIEDADPAIVSPAWPAIQASISQKPERYLLTYGIPAPTDSVQTPALRSLAASKGKGPKTATDEAAQDRRLAAGWAAKRAAACDENAYRRS